MNIKNLVLVALLYTVSFQGNELFAASDRAKLSRACRAKGSLKCSYCEERFQDQVLLRVHERRHAAESSLEYQSMEGKAEIFQEKSYADLTGHEVACETCGLSCPSVAARNMHMRVHTGVKPYQCSYCEARFSVNTTWKRHEAGHRGEKLFSCDLCGDKFTRKESMQGHRRIHTGENPYQCETCGLAFRTNGILKNHLKHQCTPNERSSTKKVGRKKLVARPVEAIVPVVEGQAQFANAQQGVAGDGLMPPVNSLPFDDNSFLALLDDLSDEEFGLLEV